MRGGFTVHVTRVRENRAYCSSHHVDVPWSNKDLELKWEHFTCKLLPGQKETWSLEIRNPKSEIRTTEKAVAEMVATLYDESLDAYRKQAWLRKFGVFRQDYSQRNTDFGNVAKAFNHLKGSWKSDTRTADLRYREFPADLVANFWGYGWVGGRNRALGLARGGVAEMEQTGEGIMLFDAAPAVNAPAPAALAVNGLVMEKAAARPQAGLGGAESRRADKPGGGDGGEEAPSVDLSKVSARKNLNETAFFFPQLTSDANGVVRMTFTMPEALTKWQFLGFAHDQSAAQRLPGGPGRHGQGPDGPAEPAALPARGRHASSSRSRSPTRPPQQAPDARQRCSSRFNRGARTSQPADKLPRQRDSPSRTSTSRPRNRAAFAWRLTRARWLRVPHLQGRRRDRPACRTARKAICRCSRGGSSSPNRCRCRFAARRRRSSSSPSCSSRASLEDAPEPEPDRADGVATRRGTRCMALPYLMEYPVRVQRADLQPALRQRAGPHHRQHRSEDPPHLRPVEGHAGAGQPAGEEPGPQGGDARGDALGAAGRRTKARRAGMSASCSTTTG